jgi:hypothetical protein
MKGYVADIEDLTEANKDFRQFFVSALQGLTLREGDFSEDRVALLRHLLRKENSRSS